MGDGRGVGGVGEGGGRGGGTSAGADAVYCGKKSVESPYFLRTACHAAT